MPQLVANKDASEVLIGMAQSAYKPAITNPALVAGTALQEATGLPSTWVIPVKGKAAGKVQIGPAAGELTEVAPIEVPASSQHILNLKVPPNWFVKVTLTEGSLGTVAAY